MDTYLAVTSRRDHKRRYADRPLPDDVARRILDAGRVAGSAVNRQPWLFVLVESPDARRRLAGTVYSPDYVLSAALAVVLVATGGKPAGLDHGRAAQNMFLTAWNEGVASAPTGFADAEAARAALGLGEDEKPALVLTFGYAESPRDASARPAEEWSARADRRPLEELIRRI